jgi:muramoyltetrapeptide carboxypeptidase LdcA involved in peptidoglycan recycling
LGSGFGHGTINQVLPLGTQASLDFISKEEASLKIQTNKSAYI